MAHDPEDEILNEKNPRPLDEDDIALLKTYVRLKSLANSVSSVLFLFFQMLWFSWLKTWICVITCTGDCSVKHFDFLLSIFLWVMF